MGNKKIEVFDLAKGVPKGLTIGTPSKVTPKDPLSIPVAPVNPPHPCLMPFKTRENFLEPFSPKLLIVTPGA